MLIQILINIQYLHNVEFSFDFKVLKKFEKSLVRFPPSNKKILNSKFALTRLARFAIRF